MAQMTHETEIEPPITMSHSKLVEVRYADRLVLSEDVHTRPEEHLAHGSALLVTTHL